MLIKKSQPLYSLFDVFDDFSRMEKEISKIMDGGFITDGGHFPKMNVYTTKDNKLVFKAVIAGIPKDQVKVSIKKNTLIFERSKLEVKDEDKTIETNKYYVRELTDGSFVRKFVLPDDINIDSMGSSYEDGVITITFDKKPDFEKEIKF